MTPDIFPTKNCEIFLAVKVTRRTQNTEASNLHGAED